MFAFPRLSAHSLRRRLLWPTFVFAIIILGATVALLRSMTTQLLAERIRNRSTALAHMVATAVEIEHDPERLRRMVTALGAEPQIVQIVVVVGSPPRVLAATHTEWTDRALSGIGDPRLAAQVLSVDASRRELGTMLRDQDAMSFVVPIQRETASGRPLRGAVATMVDRHALRIQTERWLWGFGAVVIALELLGLLAAELALRRYVLRPIQAMADTAARRQAGDRSARATVYADDEIGRLATTLNQTLGALNATLGELEFQKSTLDQAATVCVTNAAGKILYVNDAYCLLCGYSREELVGRNPRIVNSAHHPPEFFREMHEIIASGRVWRGEICNRNRNGSLYWVHSTVVPSLDAAGRPERYAAILYDISERKLAEEEARVADARFRDVANSAPALIWMADADQHAVFFNQPWLDFTGRTLEEERGRGWAEGVHPDDLERVLRSFGEAFEQQLPNTMEYRIRRHDGKYRMVLDKGIPRFRDGVFLGYIGSCIDITERAAIEHAIRANEARTRQIIDTALDAVITLDQSGRIAGWNLQAEQVFGWSAGEAIGRTLNETIVPLQYRAAHEHGLARVLRTGEGNVMGQRIEISALRRNGDEFPVELSISALSIEGASHFSAFVRDISERKRAETDLVRAKDAAQAASRAKSEFLATMSHEIRTPMNGVIGFTELLLDTPLDATQREYTETIRSSGQSLLALINDILDFSKIEAGKLNLERAPFDARHAAGEVVELLSARAEQQGLEVVFEWPGEVPSQMMGDAARFRQVLLNLTGNAVKFTQSGAVFVRAELDSRGRLRMQVRDTGIGIAEDKLSTLFRKFTQADSSTTRRFGGTGLGLAISKQLVELMGGEIGVESRPGEGSTFWFTLALPAEPVAADPPADVPGVAGLRVLVVDDLEPNRRAYCSQLARSGVEAVPAANAEAALVMLRVAAAAGRPFRAALLDLHMPGTDGKALAARILADPATGAPALVLLVPGSHRHEAAALRTQGFAGVLCKPVVRAESLLQAIARATSGSANETGGTPEPPPPATTARPEDATLLPFAGTRVLLAEDQPVNQRLALRILGKLGCNVDVADNGIDACALAAATNYDLILMDCHMPEMDGYETTTAIRTREADAIAGGATAWQAPIVALTASALKEDRDRCLASGMDDFISKPFRPDQIRSALERWTRPGGAQGEPRREAA